MTNILLIRDILNSFGVGLPASALTEATESWTSRGIAKFVLRYHIDMSFHILFCTVLTVALPVSLSSLPRVERPTASVICFMSFILRKSDLRYFLLYLKCVSACYSGLDFVMLAMYASQKSHIASYRGWLVFSFSFLWTGLLSIPDLSSESPSLRAASICSSGFSPLQHPFACSVLMAYRTVHVRMWISGVETRKEGLPGEMGEGLERGEKGEGI
jgi:hypothetical protein